MKALQRNIPFLATLSVCVLLYIAASVRYEGFFSLRVFLNFLSDNAVLGVAAIGLTFVILSGGIDLSVGSVIGVVSIILAILVDGKGLSPAIAIPLVLTGGAIFGAGMGTLIHYYALPAFLVTLGGMFFARGLGFMIKLESMPITKLGGIVDALTVSLGENYEVGATTIVFVGLLLVGILIAHFTRFGRNI